MTAEVKSQDDILSAVCDLRHQAEILATVVGACKRQLDYLKDKKAICGALIDHTGFDQIIFQSGEVAAGLRQLEADVDAISAAG